MFNAKQRVSDFVKNCYICSIAKSQRMKKNLQGATKQAQYPKHIMSFDIFGAVETDTEGYRYVYNFIDNFSLFNINIKAKTKSVKEMMAAFLLVFSIWSEIPEIVNSDNETGLMTTEAEDFFKSFNITHNHSASHSHWRLLSETAGIRKSKEFLRSILVSSPTTKWPDALLLATIALNNTKTQYDYTPLQMFFGNSRAQLNILREAEIHDTATSYMDSITAKYDKMVQTINEARAESVTQRNKLVNEHRISKQFEEGDLVWLKSLNISPHRATKLQNSGPFIVKQKLNSHTYKLSSVHDPEKVKRISHSTHMEKYKNNIDNTSMVFPNISA